MTYPETIAAGGGTIEYIVSFDGLIYRLGTSEYTSGAVYTYLPGLVRESIKFKCDSYPGEVWPEVSSIDLEFVDKDGTLRDYLKGIEGVNRTELTASIDDDDTTINVVSTTGFASAGNIFIGLETIDYTGKTATSFTGCTRGDLVSNAMEHIFDDTVFPPCIPEVTDGPLDLYGRRCIIYACEIVDGAIDGPTLSPIWRGYVDGYISFTGDSIHIPVAHVSKAFASGVVASWLPASPLRGLYIPNYDGARWGRIRVYDETTGAQTVDVVTDDSVELFESFADLWEATLAAWEAASVTGWMLSMNPDGKVSFTGPGGNTTSTLYVAGYLAEILGFRGNTIFGANQHNILATELPSTMFVSFDFTAGFDLRLYVREDSATHFEESYVYLSDGETSSAPIKVLHVDTTNDYLEISNDLAGDTIGTGWGDAAHSRSTIGVMQCWGLAGFQLHECVRSLYAGAVYSGAAGLDYTVPARWLAAPHLDDDDVDWDQLEALVQSSPTDLQTINYYVREPTQVSEIITGALLACGIYAYVKRDGTIGWRRCAIPAVEEATTTVDNTYLDANRLTQITTELGRDRLINVAKFTFNDKEDDFRSTMVAVDNKSLQRYGGKVARNIFDPAANLTDRAPEIKLWVNGLVSNNGPEFFEAIARHFASTVFDFHSKPRPYVRLPVTPQLRTLEIGEPVLLTCEWAHDRTNGTLGVTNQLGLCVGWEQTEETGDRTDWVTLLLAQEEYAAIAPTALATAHTSSPSDRFTILVDDNYCRDDDDTDMDYFEAGDELYGYEIDAASPDTFTCTITSIDIDNGYIYTDTPVGTITVPCALRFAAYASCTSDQQGEYWCWVADDGDGQIQNERIGYRWS